MHGGLGRDGGFSSLPVSAPFSAGAELGPGGFTAAEREHLREQAAAAAAAAAGGADGPGGAASTAIQQRSRRSGSDSSAMMRAALQRRLAAAQRASEQTAARAQRHRIDEAESEGGSGNAALSMALPLSSLELGLAPFAALDATDFGRGAGGGGGGGGGLGSGGGGGGGIGGWGRLPESASPSSAFAQPTNSLSQPSRFVDLSHPSTSSPLTSADRGHGPHTGTDTAPGAAPHLHTSHHPVTSTFDPFGGLGARRGSGSAAFSPRAADALLRSEETGRLGLSPRLAALSLVDDQHPTLTGARHPLTLASASVSPATPSALLPLGDVDPGAVSALPGPALGSRAEVSAPTGRSAGGLTAMGWGVGSSAGGGSGGGGNGAGRGGGDAADTAGSAALSGLEDIIGRQAGARRRALTTPAQPSAARAWARNDADAVLASAAVDPHSPLDGVTSAVVDVDAEDWMSSLPAPRTRALTTTSRYADHHDGTDASLHTQ